MMKILITILILTSYVLAQGGLTYQKMDKANAVPMVTDPSPCVIGQSWYNTTSNLFKSCDVGNVVVVHASQEWVLAQGYSTGGSTIPSGLIALIISGTCPTTWTEVSALNGKMLRGTLAANGDVGTTGGNATITPAGTVQQAIFTGDTNNTSAVSGGTPAGTNGTVTSGATSGGTPAGTNSTGTVTPLGTIAWPAGVPTGVLSWPAGVPTNGAIALGTFVNSATATTGNCAATNVLIGTGAANACKATAPNLTVPAEGHSGSLTPSIISWPAGVPTVVLSWPAGVPTLSGSSSVTSAEIFTGSALATHTHSVPAETFTGNALGTHLHTVVPTGNVNAQSFTGNAIDPSPAYVKVIFCSKN